MDVGFLAFNAFNASKIRDFFYPRCVRVCLYLYRVISSESFREARRDDMLNLTDSDKMTVKFEEKRPIAWEGDKFLKLT